MTGADTDLLVAGGGPVGLATAVLARLAGLEATVLERRAGALDKACGEGLMPSALAALAALGVCVDGPAFHGIRYVDGARAVEARFRHGSGRGVRRTTLHAALAQRAEEVGVRVVRAPVGQVRQGPGWVEAGGVRARWLVGADGLHSGVRRQVGLDRPARGPARYGLRRHYRVVPWTDLVEVHWGPRAEAYVTPVAPDLVGVAVLSGGGSSYDDLLGRFPALRVRLEGAPAASAVRGAGPLRQQARRRVSGRVLLVGDAAGYVDALTGEGIAVGLAGARELVRCVLAERPEDYEAAWRRASRRSRSLTGALLWSTQRPALRARLVAGGQRWPAAFAGAVEALA